MTLKNDGCDNTSSDKNKSESDETVACIIKKLETDMKKLSVSLEGIAGSVSAIGDITVQTGILAKNARSYITSEEPDKAIAVLGSDAAALAEKTQNSFEELEVRLLDVSKSVNSVIKGAGKVTSIVKSGVLCANLMP